MAPLLILLTNRRFRPGLKELIYVKFRIQETWVRWGLDKIFRNIGIVRDSSRIQRGATYYWTVLVEFNKRRFEYTVNLRLRDRSVRSELDYDGLAFRCYICRAIDHCATECRSNPNRPLSPPRSGLQLPQPRSGSSSPAARSPRRSSPSSPNLKSTPKSSPPSRRSPRPGDDERRRYIPRDSC